MSSSETPLLRRRALLVGLSLLPLSACGFTPVYGPGGAGGALQNRIDFEDPRNTNGFSLVAQLEDRLGRADTPAYRLGYEIRTRSSSLGVTGAANVKRVNLIGDVTYSVSDIASGLVVETGRVSTFTAYATSGSPVATLAARRDAEERLMTALADQIVTRLISGSADWA